jgi:hypothetical protein
MRPTFTTTELASLRTTTKAIILSSSSTSGRIASNRL